MARISPISLIGQRIIIGFSGGPDAAALAHKLKSLGAEVIPVYVNYRKISGGGKTTKDLNAAIRTARSLGLPNPMQIRKPLGKRAGSQRNRFFIKVLASIAKQRNGRFVAIGTMRESGNEREFLGRAMINDLDPKILSDHGRNYGVKVLTWDSFGIRNKADEFKGVSAKVRNALFQTTSCQMWWRLECGNCHSCINRHGAFLKTFGYDLTFYRPKSTVARQELRR